jgi:hypothetical protein
MFSGQLFPFDGHNHFTWIHLKLRLENASFVVAEDANALAVSTEDGIAE